MLMDTVVEITCHANVEDAGDAARDVIVSGSHVFPGSSGWGSWMDGAIGVPVSVVWQVLRLRYAPLRMTNLG